MGILNKFPYKESLYSEIPAVYGRLYRLIKGWFSKGVMVTPAVKGLSNSRADLPRRVHIIRCPIPVMRTVKRNCYMC
jgi:hypothetical protein